MKTLWVPIKSVFICDALFSISLFSFVSHTSWLRMWTYDVESVSYCAVLLSVHQFLFGFSAVSEAVQGWAAWISFSAKLSSSSFSSSFSSSAWHACDPKVLKSPLSVCWGPAQGGKPSQTRTKPEHTLLLSHQQDSSFSSTTRCVRHSDFPFWLWIQTNSIFLHPNWSLLLLFSLLHWFLSVKIILVCVQHVRHTECNVNSRPKGQTHIMWRVDQWVLRCWWTNCFYFWTKTRSALFHFSFSIQGHCEVHQVSASMNGFNGQVKNELIGLRPVCQLL